MKKIGLNLLKAAESFNKNQDKLTEQFGTMDDDRLTRQIEKILETKDVHKIFLLVQFLNVCCRHSMRRYGLIKFRLGKEIVAKLEDESFHICNCTNWSRVGHKAKQKKEPIIHAIRSLALDSNSKRKTICGINIHNFRTSSYLPNVTCKRCLGHVK